jgi:hypothetical protein
MVRRVIDRAHKRKIRNSIPMLSVHSVAVMSKAIHVGRDWKYLPSKMAAISQLLLTDFAPVN